jgi:hypothetical protein
VDDVCIVSVARFDAGTTILPLVGRFDNIANFARPTCPTAVAVT